MDRLSIERLRYVVCYGDTSAPRTRWLVLAAFEDLYDANIWADSVSKAAPRGYATEVVDRHKYQFKPIQSQSTGARCRAASPECSTRSRRPDEPTT